MDGDPKVESGLDSFSLTFPLPYRVGFIIILAVWGWGINLQYLTRAKIDVPSLIKYPARTSVTQPAHHLSTYRLATVLSALFSFSITIFWLFTRRNPELVIQYDWMPMTFLVATTLRRVSIGGIAQAQDGKFGDILLADALTSYAKVLADLYVTLCMFFTPTGASTARPDRGCGGAVMCLTEYFRVRRAPYKESTGWGGQHLANAAKYSTAFPVIILSAIQRSLPADQPKPGLNRAWLAAVLLNSLYSFYWDVTKDWDLTLFAPARERSAPDHPFGLRRRLLFYPPLVYYLVMGLDLMLRCTWALKLSPHLDRLRVRRAPYKESTGWGGQHLANAAKYSTAFPVIILSAIQRSLPADQPKPGLNRAWLAAVLLNSLYSFYWDVTKDWDLTLFAPARERSAPDHPFGLRRRLLFYPPLVYYLVMGLDLMLRCTWALKLSPHLDRLTDFESSIFLIQFLEVFRRWVWIFFRVETEWIRNSPTGLGVDDILLGDYQGSLDRRR
ncbi:Protein ERD1 2 like protein [Verticillium longisporum]|uniref:Protein ERD1 2 like protein n=2 Tax=Verticillium longisporum TaxID=100787 RepID=A0A8I3AJQ2_VERLO|nr:Protein ERD1 2 like protein [Verticillium longisporum]